ncbi:hypothetical protein A0H81_04806 [Grifola frondosa]|uniref:Uncharacterized protein n=1 Tax=Grifola frondosa TaxID=5627 RepID=A0A1C7MH34_GRIFR|nr:hypothetical protein A0H81_04806 [Grifola frondosa]
MIAFPISQLFVSPVSAAIWRHPSLVLNGLLLCLNGIIVEPRPQFRGPHVDFAFPRKHNAQRLLLIIEHAHSGTLLDGACSIPGCYQLEVVTPDLGPLERVSMLAWPKCIASGPASRMECMYTWPCATMLLNAHLTNLALSNH